MPDIIGGLSAATGIAGLFLEADANEAAQDALDLQGQAAIRQVRLSEQMFEHWFETWAPVEAERAGMVSRVLPSQEEAIKSTLEGVPEDRAYLRGLREEAGPRYDAAVDEAAGRINASFDTQKAIARRELERRGAGAPTSAAGIRDWDLAQAGSRAAVVNQAVRDERSESFDRKRSLLGPAYNAAVPQGSGSFSPVAATAGLASAANTYGDLAYANRLQASDYGAGAAAALKYGMGRLDPPVQSYDYAQPAISPSAMNWLQTPAARSVRHYAGGGLVEGPGSGTSDSVPAVVDGSAPAQLSDGEFVIPAQMVEAIVVNALDELAGGRKRR